MRTQAEIEVSFAGSGFTPIEGAIAAVRVAFEYIGGNEDLNKDEVLHALFEILNAYLTGEEIKRWIFPEKKNLQ